MIGMFLWYAAAAFLGTMILHAFILHGPSKDKIVDPEAHKSLFYKPKSYGFKVIPSLAFCTPYGKKLVGLYWLFFLSFLPSMVVYMAYA